MNIGTWSNINTNIPSSSMLQPFRTSDKSNSSGGKMKRESTIRHESHHPPPILLEPPSAKNPVLAFLEARNNALPIKNLPAFNLNNEKRSPPMIKRESTGSTIPMRSAQSLLRQHTESSQTSISSQDSPSASPQASPVRRLDPAQSEPATTTVNFGFAMPPPLVPKNSMSSLEATEANKTINFSFCQPEEVAQVSSMSDLKMASPHHSNSTTAKTSPKTSLITNHTALPDLTATMRSSSHDGQNNIKSAPKSLKSGSVMDILGSRKSSLYFYVSCSNNL